MPEHDVLNHGVRGYQLSFLMNHPYSQVNRVLRRSENDSLAVNVDLAFVRLQQPEQDAHQGGFAGPVFAEDCMDLARADLEIYGVIRDDPRESLCDPPCLEDRLAGPKSLQRLFLHLTLLQAVLKPHRKLHPGSGSWPPQYET